MSTYQIQSYDPVASNTAPPSQAPRKPPIWAFGVIGFVMVKNGFPLTPMVLGVVLGPLAELNLSRSLSTSDDLSLFFTRPWAMFFIVLGVFSACFPVYQSAVRAGRAWSRFYGSAFVACAAVPLMVMEGWFRAALGVALLLLAVLMVARRLRRGAGPDAGAT